MAKKKAQFLTAAVLISALWSVSVLSSWASSAQEHKFAGRTDGESPMGTLVSDGAGNFYGTTPNGGSTGSFGTVFKWSRSQSGQWIESVIYSFMNGADGEYPGGLLALDSSGNLYGVAAHGTLGNGLVWKLSPNTNGTWSETTVYNFQNGTDGSVPTWGITSDSSGNLYGTTAFGGGGCSSGMCGGTVFKLTPGENGQWTFTTVYAFQSGTDGWDPNPVIADVLGNIYGTTGRGGDLQGECGIGNQGCGTVYEITSSLAGGWIKTTLYMFDLGADGGYPSSQLAFDNIGNLYGETFYGGSLTCANSGCGVIFKLSPEGTGTWTFSVAHTFNGVNGALGQLPSGGLTLDRSGNFYGTTQAGGKSTFCTGGCGTIFELSPNANGEFSFRLLVSFNGYDGWAPAGAVTLDTSGVFYGTTYDGGNLKCNPPLGCGVVFEATP